MHPPVDETPAGILAAVTLSCTASYELHMADLNYVCTGLIYSGWRISGRIQSWLINLTINYYYYCKNNFVAINKNKNKQKSK